MMLVAQFAEKLMPQKNETESRRTAVENLKLHITNMPTFGFGFREFNGEQVDGVETSKPCPHPDGHLWQKQPQVLLSNPPQEVYSCVREGCDGIRHIARRVPEQPLLIDEQLKEK